MSLAFHEWCNAVTTCAHEIVRLTESLRFGGNHDRWEELFAAGDEMEELLADPPEQEDEP